MTMKTFCIDEISRENLLALFDEMQVNGELGIENLYAWWLGEQDSILSAISDLEDLVDIDDVIIE